MTERTEKQKAAIKKNLAKGKATRFKSGKEAAESGRKGGIASGIKKREEKSVADKFKVFLNLTVGSGEATDIDGLKEIADVQAANLTVGDQIVIKMVELARKGNVKAAELSWRMIGQVPKEQTELIVSEKPPEDMDINELANAIKKRKQKAKE